MPVCKDYYYSKKKVFFLIMPLIQGCSKDAAQENYSKMLDEGRSEDKAFAIAASVARENIKKCGETRQKEIRNGEIL